MLWLGETLGFWIQTGALVISAVAAVWLLRSSTKRQKMRATVDMVLELSKDPDYKNARKTIRKLHDDKVTNFSKYIQDKDSNEYHAILNTLNTYEFMASGIRCRAFDEYVYKRMLYSTIVNDWSTLQGFIAELRIDSDRSSLFQDFCWLGARWDDDKLKDRVPWYRKWL